MFPNSPWEISNFSRGKSLGGTPVYDAHKAAVNDGADGNAHRDCNIATSSTRSLCSDLEEVRATVDRLSPENLSIVLTWALSEMPMALREQIEPFLHLLCCTKALLSYQATFEGTDNRRYFSDLMNRTATRMRWTDTLIGPPGTAHIPPAAISLSA